MIDRFDSSGMIIYLSGRYVLYSDYLAEITELKAENKRLEESLIYYVKESYKVEA